MSAQRIVVLPPQRLGILVVGADAAHELAVQVRDRGEDAAAGDVALSVGEPVLDLVEPGRVGRYVVDPDLWVLAQELVDEVGLGAADFVADDVDLALRRLAGDESPRVRWRPSGLSQAGMAASLASCL